MKYYYSRAGVVIKSQHLCSAREVESTGTEMVTSSLFGSSNQILQQERVFDLIK